MDDSLFMNVLKTFTELVDILKKRRNKVSNCFAFKLSYFTQKK